MTIKRPKLLYHENHKINHLLHYQMQQQEDDQQDELIPGLPNHISHLILSKLPPLLLYSVSPSWRHFLHSPHSPPFLSLYALLTPILTSSSTVVFSCYDPISSKWMPLPPPPLPLLSRHPSFISRTLPIQATTACSRLIVVAATSRHLLPALPRPLIFQPLTSTWSLGPALPVPRRWCAAGSLSGSIYVASGVGSHFSSSSAKSAHFWDPQSTSAWAPCRPLRHGRFSREAIDAVGWKGGLYMANANMKEGVVYDVKEDTWRDMAEGTVAGWRGPVATMAEEVVYVVDEGKGVLRRYDEEGDCWVDVLEDERFRGAHHVAADGGRVCVVCGGGGILVVDVAAAMVRTWVVEPPVGYKAVAVHILPRMSTTSTQ